MYRAGVLCDATTRYVRTYCASILNVSNTVYICDINFKRYFCNHNEIGTCTRAFQMLINAHTQRRRCLTRWQFIGALPTPWISDSNGGVSDSRALWWRAVTFTCRILHRHAVCFCWQRYQQNECLTWCISTTHEQSVRISNVVTDVCCAVMYM